MPLAPLPVDTPRTAIPAAIYARVSTLKQGEDWHVSLDVQAQECLAFAERNGFVVDPQCIVKEPYTSTTLDRPAFEHLLADMVRRGIRHLIMDKPDRVTREGQVTAAYFIHRLQEIDVTLHLALSNFTVKDEITISVFLNYAFAAKLDNDQRVANVQRTRREAARSLGRYVKGNRPPYGWRLEAATTDTRGRSITFRLVHDPETYPVLLRMLHERQAGRSYREIASDLTADGIPTSAAHAGMRNAAGKEWHQASVKGIVRHPINAGIVTGFRHRMVAAPPDARHARRWYRQVSVPASEQIALPSDLVVDPPLTPDEYRWLIGPQALTRRSDGTRRKAPAMAQASSERHHHGVRHRASELAVGYGGLFRHGACGGTMRTTYSRYKEKEYIYYSCALHHDVPERCPSGVVIRAEELDRLVWDAVVRDVLLVPGKLEQLAEEQRQADLAGTDPSSELRRLQRMQADVLAGQESLLDTIQHASNEFVRRLAEKRLAELEPTIVQIDANMVDAQRRFTNEEQRRAILADVQAQVGRYALLLEYAHLLPTPYRVATQRRVLRALGFRATVDKMADGRLDIVAELRLAAGQPGLWFTAEETQRALDAAQREGFFALIAPGAGLKMEEPVSEQALLDLLRDVESSLPTLRAQIEGRGAQKRPEPGAGRRRGSSPTPEKVRHEAHEAREAASVGRVRFVTDTSSSCP